MRLGRNRGICCGVPRFGSGDNCRRIDSAGLPAAVLLAFNKAAKNGKRSKRGRHPVGRFAAPTTAFLTTNCADRFRILENAGLTTAAATAANCRRSIGRHFVQVLRAAQPGVVGSRLFARPSSRLGARRRCAARETPTAVRFGSRPRRSCEAFPGTIRSTPRLCRVGRPIRDPANNRYADAKPY